jgi:hypothetical protein
MKTLSRKDFGSTPPPPPDRQANCSAALHFTKGNHSCSKGMCEVCIPNGEIRDHLGDAGAAIGAVIARG